MYKCAYNVLLWNNVPSRILVICGQFELHIFLTSIINDLNNKYISYRSNKTIICNNRLFSSPQSNLYIKFIINHMLTILPLQAITLREAISADHIHKISSSYFLELENFYLCYLNKLNLTWLLEKILIFGWHSLHGKYNAEHICDY